MLQCMLQCVLQWVSSHLMLLTHAHQILSSVRCVAVRVAVYDAMRVAVYVVEYVAVHVAVRVAGCVAAGVIRRDVARA